MQQVLRTVVQETDLFLLMAGNRVIQNRLFDNLLPLLDKVSYWIAPVALVVIGVLVFGGWRGFWAVICAAVVLILTDQASASLLKPLISRIRPCNIVPDLHIWWEHRWILTPDPVIEIYKASWSFPSSHAANSAGQALWWGWNFPKYRWWAAGYAGIIGYSRIYLGHHWPSDVMIGWLLGIFAAGIVIFIAGFQDNIHFSKTKARRAAPVPGSPTK